MGEHLQRWYRSHWSKCRGRVQTSMNKNLPAFMMQTNPVGQFVYTGPPEIREALQPFMDTIVGVMEDWAKRQEGQDADTRATTKVILVKPSKPVAQLGNKEIRYTLVKWIRTLNPNTALPNYNKPEKKPTWWPVDIPWSSPYNKPPGFDGDWTAALRRVMASCLRHVGEDPETFYRPPAPGNRRRGSRPAAGQPPVTDRQTTAGHRPPVDAEGQRPTLAPQHAGRQRPTPAPRPSQRSACPSTPIHTATRSPTSPVTPNFAIWHSESDVSMSEGDVSSVASLGEPSPVPAVPARAPSKRQKRAPVGFTPSTYE